MGLLRHQLTGCITENSPDSEVEMLSCEPKLGTDAQPEDPA